MAVAASPASFVEFKRDETSDYTVGKLRIAAFAFESGITLPEVDVAFETWGTLNAARDNVVVVCHALTGDAHCGSGGGTSGWWEQLIGPGRAIDTNHKFVIASNVLGGCSGSTGPASRNPKGRLYALQFPLVTVRDMVRAQIALVDALGVDEIDTVIGGSLGGMQAWEWPWMAPNRVKQTIVIAAQPVFPPLGIGYNEAMRQAIVSDPAWQGGNYYGTGHSPVAGLMTARSIGMLTYRSGTLFNQRFARTRAVQGGHNDEEPALLEPNPHDVFTKPQFAVEDYLHYQGRKLHARFDPNSYLYLTRAMDAHDVGRGRGGLLAAFGNLRTRLILIGIDTDYLYDARELERFAGLAVQSGVDATYFELKSVHGHDAFLLEQAQLGRLIGNSERSSER